MKFSAISIIPDQERSTTPDVFITDPYGKAPSLDNDGALLVNQEIRLSRIISKYTPAFSGGNNKVIYGFVINQQDVKQVNNDLHITISEGVAVVNKRVFKVPHKITAIWPNFVNAIPPQLPNGQILIYFEHKDIITNYVDRPYGQREPYEPTKKYPDNQVGFNPVYLCYAFYDPINQSIVGSSWDTTTDKSLITGSITYNKKPNGTIDINIDPSNKDDIIIVSPENIILPQESGGSIDHDIDGGILNLNNEIIENKKPNGINLVIKQIITQFDELIPIPGFIPDKNNFFVFLNGMLMDKNSDWSINSNNQLEFTPGLLKPGYVLYAFSNIAMSAQGSLIDKNYQIIQSNNLTNININGIDENKSYLVFINGILQTENLDYTLRSNYINFTYPLHQGYRLNVIEIYEAISTPQYVQIIYDGNAVDSLNMGIFGIDPNKYYLIFYNGLLYLEAYDYLLSANTIKFQTLPLSSSKKIFILGV